MSRIRRAPHGVAVPAVLATVLVSALHGAAHAGEEIIVDPIEPVLLGANSGSADDVLTVEAPEAAAGAVVKLFKVKRDGSRELAAKDVLNAKGNRRFVVADANGNKRTRYVARIAATDETAAGQTNVKRVR